MPRACVLYSAKVIIITFALCNTNSKNETEEGYLVLSGTTPKMMVYWTMLSLFLFSFVFPLVVLFFDSVFSVRALVPLPPF
jgi:peptidoglycan/LPS O-acetylase OafA/YrhL